jgi:hypothetical protein
VWRWEAIRMLLFDRGGWFSLVSMKGLLLVMITDDNLIWLAFVIDLFGRDISIESETKVSWKLAESNGNIEAAVQ